MHSSCWLCLSSSSICPSSLKTHAPECFRAFSKIRILMASCRLTLCAVLCWPSLDYSALSVMPSCIDKNKTSPKTKGLSLLGYRGFSFQVFALVIPIPILEIIMNGLLLPEIYKTHLAEGHPQVWSDFSWRNDQTSYLLGCCYERKKSSAMQYIL